MTTAGAEVEVVMVCPRLLIVVMATSTLTDADDSKTDVVSATTLPAESVVENTRGTRTPVAVAAERVPLEMARGVLTIVDPAESVVVTGAGVEAAIADDATTEETIVLPALLVVVIGIVVGAIEDPSSEEPADDGAAESAVVAESDPSVEPTTGCELGSDETTDETTVLPALLVVVTGTVIGTKIGELCAVESTAEEPASDEAPAAVLAPVDDGSAEVAPAEDAPAEVGPAEASCVEAAGEDTGVDACPEEARVEAGSSDEETCALDCPPEEDEGGLDDWGLEEAVVGAALSPSDVVVGVASVVVGASVVAGAVVVVGLSVVTGSVVKDTAVVVGSVTTTGTVVLLVSSVEVVVAGSVPFCLFFRSILAACFATSNNLDASDGSSSCTFSIAL